MHTTQLMHFYIAHTFIICKLHSKMITQSHSNRNVIRQINPLAGPGFETSKTRHLAKDSCYFLSNHFSPFGSQYSGGPNCSY